MDYPDKFTVGKSISSNLMTPIVRCNFGYQKKQSSVSPINQFLISLRFCAAGAHSLVVVDLAGVNSSSASHIIATVIR